MPVDRRVIVCDDRLRAVLGRDRFDMPTMTGLLSPQSRAVRGRVQRRLTSPTVDRGSRGSDRRQTAEILDIEMRSEDLSISTDEIRVRYRFFNHAASAITTELAERVLDILIDEHFPVALDFPDLRIDIRRNRLLQHVSLLRRLVGNVHDVVGGSMLKRDDSIERLLLNLVDLIYAVLDSTVRLGR